MAGSREYTAEVEAFQCAPGTALPPAFQEQMLKDREAEFEEWKRTGKLRK